ncbi:hypothetical protein M9H77_04091 [Catharanthus roseus]|uniref:Uncharacterized protein n=1 Tax=Catharanthus roseus TaxID=4058 RepID=A0ACC0CDI5_CATRO|nr:hypothetical protein M9H77_04091 [Catharanthus roseus]
MSHGLPCSCKLITRFDHMFPIQLDDISAFWRTLEIEGDHPCSQKKDMDIDYEIRDLADLLDQISTRLISKVKEMYRLVKGVLSLVLPEDPGMTLTSPLEITATKGRWKTNSTKNRQGSGSGYGSGSGSDSRGRGKPPRARRDASPCSTFPYIEAFPSFVHPFIENWKNVNGDGNCGYQVVANFIFGDEHQ